MKEQDVTEKIEEFYEALAQEQFVVYLQPQYNQRNCTLYGAEALVRWIHPERGLISPAAFIPFLERHDLIGQLDQYVIKKSCQYQREWMDQGLTIVPVSVNLSRRELQSEAICQKVDQMVQDAHLDRSAINLEITETAYMEDPTAVTKVVQRFQQLGYKVEMDDFGSGYSSLNSLKDNTVDILKLDMDFINGEAMNPRGAEILSSVVRMSHWLGMPVIAEGVETKEQADFLRSIGCYYVQGYYFDRPMPAEEFEKRLRNRGADPTRGSRYTSKTEMPIEFLSTDDSVKLLLDSALGAAGIVEYDGSSVVFVRMNDAMCDMFGLDAPNVEGRKVAFESVFLREHTKRYLEAIQKAVDSENVSECETLNVLDGNRLRLFWTRTRFKFLRSFDGVSTLFIAVDNIDKYKRAMQTNAQLLYEMDEIEHGNYFGSIMIVEETQQLSYVNKTAAAMFGYSVEEFQEALLDDAFALIPEPAKSILLERMEAELYEEPFMFSTTVPVKCKDGKMKTIHTIVAIKTVFGGTRIINFLLLDRRSMMLQQDETFLSDEVLLQKELMDTRSIADTLGRRFVQYSPNEDRILYASQEFAEMLGYTSEEMEVVCWEPFENLVWPSDRENVFKTICQDIESYGQYKGCEDYRLIKKDGGEKWVSSRNHEVMMSNGRKMVFVTFEDRDDVHRLRQRMRSTHAFHQAIDQNPFGGIVIYKIVGKRWTIDYISEGYQHLLKMSDQQLRELAENDMLAGLHPDDRERVRQMSILHGKPGDSYQVQYRCLNGEGKYDWFLSYMAGYKNDDEIYVYQSVIKVTGLRQLEKKLQGENRRLDAILNAIPGGIILFEMLPENKSRIRYASEGIAKLSGRSIEEYHGVINQDYRPNVYSADEPLLASSMRRTAETGEPMHITMRMVHSDGHLFWLDMTGQIIGKSHGNPLLLGVYRDISIESSQFLDVMEDAEFAVIVTELSTQEVLYHNTIAETVSANLFQLTPKEICQHVIYNRNPEIPVIRNEENGASEFEIWERGHLFYVRYRRQLWHQRDSYICYIMDETNRSILQESEDYRRDITGVLTRGEITKQVVQSMQRSTASQFAMIMVDVDNMREINATFGHGVGDAALGKIARTLRASFRDPDKIGRVDGDQFLIFVDGLGDTAMVEKRLQGILKSLSSIRAMDDDGGDQGQERAVGEAGSRHYLHCSMGCLLARHGEYRFEDAYDLVERALFQAKSAGKEQYHIINTIEK